MGHPDEFSELVHVQCVAMGELPFSQSEGGHHLRSFGPFWTSQRQERGLLLRANKRSSMLRVHDVVGSSSAQCASYEHVHGCHVQRCFYMLFVKEVFLINHVFVVLFVMWG